MKPIHSPLPWCVGRSPTGPWPEIYNRPISPNIVSWICVVRTGNGSKIECSGATEEEACANADLVIQGANHIAELREHLLQIRAVACGEQQVADNDTEALKWIFERIEQLKL